MNPFRPSLACMYLLHLSLFLLCFNIVNAICCVMFVCGRFYQDIVLSNVWWGLNSHNISLGGSVTVLVEVWKF